MKHLDYESNLEIYKGSMRKLQHIEKVKRLQILGDTNIEIRVIKHMVFKFWSQRTNVAHGYRQFRMLVIEMNSASSLSQTWLYQKIYAYTKFGDTPPIVYALPELPREEVSLRDTIIFEQREKQHESFTKQWLYGLLLPSLQPTQK